MMLASTAVLVSCFQGVLGHAWITKPSSSRLDMSASHWQSGMPDDDLRYCPSCCNHMNSCGANQDYYEENTNLWDKFYAAVGVPVHTLSSGDDVEFNFEVTADHGGQSWLMVACADHIAEDIPWQILERSDGDRSHHFMPSNPGIYAWAKDEACNTMDCLIKATWTVPGNFSCPSGRGVGRWVWKTSNSCNDVNNVNNRHTETFNIKEFAKVFHEYDPDAWMLETCGEAPETFISCFDFTTTSGPAPPVPPSPPTPPPAPTPAPTPAPKGPCHALSPVVTDDWCNTNCPEYCPANLCSCKSAEFTI